MDSTPRYGVNRVGGVALLLRKPGHKRRSSPARERYKAARRERRAAAREAARD